ncbi:4b9070bf-b497-4e6f-918a-b3439cb09561 [Thermothielavioides terrestris]|nr:4b9070bf-b497-4e6f-918a-b3439cb09561 [Thermothielavioides terrestris]
MVVLWFGSNRYTPTSTCALPKGKGRTCCPTWSTGWPATCRAPRTASGRCCRAAYDAGFYAVTYALLVNAVNALAYWPVDRLGRPEPDLARDMAVLAYMGPKEVPLAALVLAAIKTAYLLFFASPRSSRQVLFGCL